MSKIKLFCLPHAGGSAFVYSKWKKYLRDDIELVPIELAGRGARMSEKLYDDLSEAIEDAVKIIEEKIGHSDYMIYGHSMGAAMAYEVTCRILEDGYKKPLHLFISGRRNPNYKDNGKMLYNLPDDEFREAVLTLGGTPKEVFDVKEYRELFVPVIRSDYKNIETFVPIHKDTVLPIDLTVINGSDDDLTEEGIGGWKYLTSEKFRRFDLPGDHFFLHETPEKVVNIINESLLLH